MSAGTAKIRVRIAAYTASAAAIMSATGASSPRFCAIRSSVSSRCARIQAMRSLM